MQVGLTISDFDGKKPGELLALARQFGVGFVEFNPTILNDIQNVSRHTNSLVAGFHLPLVSEHGFDFSCLDKKERIDDTIDLLNHHRHDLNLLYCVAHPPESESTNYTTEEALEFLLENLQRLEVPVIIENVETWSQNEYDRLVKLCRQHLKNNFIGLCFDPAHAFLRGEDIFERFSKISDNVLCIHLSDCAKGQDAHLPLGQGELPIARFLQHVSKHNYDGVINLEIMPKTIREAESVVKSYFQVLRVFNKVKYFSTISKLFFAKSKIKNIGS